MSRLNRLLGHLTRFGARQPVPGPAYRFTTPAGKTVEIRAGTAHQVPAVMTMAEQICALHRQWDSAKFGFVDGAMSMYARWLAERARDPASVFLVAMIEQRPIAFLIGVVERAPPIYRPASYGVIRDLWVEKNHRHGGIGVNLMRAATERFAVMGIAQIRLETAAANEDARSFFASCGFRPSAVELLIEC